MANSQNGAMEAVYFKLTKIKDGTFWGRVMDTYRMKDWIGLEVGRVWPFRGEAIMGEFTSLSRLQAPLDAEILHQRFQ